MVAHFPVYIRFVRFNVSTPMNLCYDIFTHLSGLALLPIDYNRSKINFALLVLLAFCWKERVDLFVSFPLRCRFNCVSMFQKVCEALARPVLRSTFTRYKNAIHTLVTFCSDTIRYPVNIGRVVSICILLNTSY